MIKYRVVVLWGILGLLSCHTDTKTRELMPYQEGPIDKIIIRLPGKVSVKDDDLLKTITDKDMVSKITVFVKSQANSRLDWKTETERGALSPAPFLNLTFYSRDVYLFSFGMGNDFFSSLDKVAGYRVRSLPLSEKKELLKLIGVTEEEYEELYQNWSKPGPWKKKHTVISLSLVVRIDSVNDEILRVLSASRVEFPHGLMEVSVHRGGHPSLIRPMIHPPPFMFGSERHGV
jgi:hypothetical protein